MGALNYAFDQDLRLGVKPVQLLLQLRVVMSRIDHGLLMFGIGGFEFFCFFDYL
jgi:hypothetical protein